MCDARKDQTKEPIILDAIEIHRVKLSIGEEIGSGIQSVVKKGRWNQLIVAIKEFTPENTQRSCEKEIKMMSYLTKAIPASVVQLYGYVKPVRRLNKQSNYKVVMEYCSLGSLADRIESEENVPSWSVRYEWMRSIVCIVADLHSCSVIHRDIKPDNFILNANNRIKVGDFGFAKRLEIIKSFEAKTMRGSAAYMAPEVWSSFLYSDKSDIFSLATVLWEISAWSLAFEHLPDEHFVETVANKIVKGDREAIPNDCPPKLAKLITWGWRANPSERPAASEYKEEFSTGLDVMSDKLKQLTF